MSQPQAPKPQQNFLQILMIAAMVFLGYQLFTAPNRAEQDKRTSAEILTEMHAMNSKLEDVSITKLYPVYESKLKAEAKEKGTPESELKQKILEGAILVVDTKLKSGAYRHKVFKEGDATRDLGYDKMFRGYDFFKPRYEGQSKSDIWANAAIEVAPTADFPETMVSAQEAYERIVTAIQPLAKENLVYGFIPGYAVIDFLVNLTGAQPWISYTLAAFVLALLVRIIVWPFTMKQLMWGKQMQQLQPRIKELQAKYQDKKTKQIKDPAAYQAETMAIYKEYGINPFSGCLPALIQMPFFLTIYQCMLTYRFEFTKGYFLWIHPGAGEFLGIPLATNLGERDYILVFLYMISMVGSTLLMPISDPENVKRQKLMGIGMAILFSVFMFFYSLPSAFIVYWIFTNILSTAQSLYGHSLPTPELKKVATATGGLLPNDVIEAKTSNGHIDPDFFGKKGTPKTNKPKKRSGKK